MQMVGFIDFLLAIALVWVIAAVVQDFRKREIPNWLNFSLLIFALAFRAFYSLFSKDFRFFMFGLFGFIIFFVLAYVFYYGRLFAGGDAKLLIALGAVVPLALSYYENILIFFLFIIALLFCGAIYSTIYSFALVLFTKNDFYNDFKNRIRKRKDYLLISIILLGLFFIASLLFSNLSLLVIGIFIFLFPLLYLYTKSVEKTCMIVDTDIKKLTVGDWLAHPIKVKNKIIHPNWEGLSQEELDYIRKNHKGKVKVKQGIPFSVAFLLALVFLIVVKYLWGSDWGLWQFF